MSTFVDMFQHFKGPGGFRQSVRLFFVVLPAVMLFHLAVLVGWLPYSIVWGGNIQTEADMLKMEGVSMAVNLLILLLVWLRYFFAGKQKEPGLLRGLFFVLFALFTLNTIGNLFAVQAFERWVFTPLTLILALCSLRLGLPQAPKSA